MKTELNHIDLLASQSSRYLMAGFALLFLGGSGFFLAVYLLYTGEIQTGAVGLLIAVLLLWRAGANVKHGAGGMERVERQKWALVQQKQDERRWENGCPLQAIELTGMLQPLPQARVFRVKISDDIYDVAFFRQPWESTHTHPAEQAEQPSLPEIREVVQRLYIRSVGVNGGPLP